MSLHPSRYYRNYRRTWWIRDTGSTVIFSETRILRMLLFACRCVGGGWATRRRRQEKPPTNLHMWQWETVLLHAFLDILKMFSFFLRREMTCFAVVWTECIYDDKFSILSCHLRSAGSNSIVRTQFSSIITLSNRKIYCILLRWSSRCRRRRVYLRSLFLI